MRKWAPAEVDQLMTEYVFSSDRTLAVYEEIQQIIYHGDLASKYGENSILTVWQSYTDLAVNELEKFFREISSTLRYFDCLI